MLAEPEENEADGTACAVAAFRLPAVLDLKAAAPLAAELLNRRGADLTVDASAVQRLGGLCLQVLLSAKSGWAEDAHALILADPSPDFLSAIELFGGEYLFSNQKESA